MKEKFKRKNAVTLVALVITIIILLLLAGIALVTLGGKNGIFNKVKQAKKAQLEAEMKEQLTMGLQELQVAKNGEATLDDVTQDWANKVILKDYNPELKEDSSYNGKMMVMTKDKITGKFMIDQNLNIISTEYNVNSMEIEYTTISRTDNKVRINIVVKDNVNGIKQIDYPKGNPLKVVSGVEKKISIDYDVELGVEYRFVVTSGDGSKTEKIIKIDDYFYNVTKTLGDGTAVDNNATKASYNKIFEATVSTTGNYVITGLTVTMGGQNVTTSGNDIVDINTGKIKIEKVTGDINITVTTKKLEIQYTAIAVSTSNSSSNTNSEKENTIEKGNTLYINIIATLEGNSCTVVSKADNSKGVPYPVTANGKYVFKVSGTYNGKTVEEEKEVTLNQFKSAPGVVKYDAGDWTKEEIEELQNQNLYMLNKEKTYNKIFNLDDRDTGLNFTFGGFTYKEDKTNAENITNGKIITNRNQSISSYSEGIEYTSKYSGWQILDSEKREGKVYVKKITHAGNPENFALKLTDGKDNFRVEYLLSGGNKRTEFNTLKTGKKIKPRSWQMYVDQSQKDFIANTTDKDGNTIKDIHSMDYYEALAITGKIEETTEIRNTGSYYWLATANESGTPILWLVTNNGSCGVSNGACLGIRPVVTMADGVYIKSGTGTEEDPYILGKDFQ